MEVIFLEQNSIRATISMVTTVSCQLIRHMLVNTDTMVMALDTSWGMLWLIIWRREMCIRDRDGTVRDVPAPAAQYPQGRNGRGGVPGLIAADQGQADAIQAVKIKGDSIQIPVLDGQPAEIHHGQRRVPLCRRTGDDGIGRGHTAIAHHRTAGLDDARLGRRDIGQGGAQLLHMIHAQRRDDRALRRVDDVGGIQRAAQAHLQHHEDVYKRQLPAVLFVKFKSEL